MTENSANYRPEIFLELRQKKGMDIDLENLRQEYMSNRKLPKTLFFIDSVAKTHEYNITFRSMIPNLGKNESGGFKDFKDDLFYVKDITSYKDKIKKTLSFIDTAEHFYEEMF